MALNIKNILKDKSNDYSELEKKFFKEKGKSFIYDICSLENGKNHTNRLSTSVVIPAWNAEDTILSCLTAIEKSSFNLKYPDRLQVVVTDDGSSDSTLKILKTSKLNLNLVIVHQENHGQGPAMNAGISAAEGDIIIEVDADTILNYFAIENLMCRHEFFKDALYTGFRSYVDNTDIRVSLDYLKQNGPEKKFEFTSDERIRYFAAGWPNSMCIASDNYKNLGNSRGLWMPNEDNDDAWLLADMVFGMTFSLPRDIFNYIGGFDDRFEGWGCDDGYVGAKAISAGVFVIPVYPVTGLHISHPFRTKDRQTEYDFNRKFFFEFINSTNYAGHPDWIALAKKRITDKFVMKPEAIETFPVKTYGEVQMNVQQLLDVGRYDEALNHLHDQTSEDENYSLNMSRALNGMKRYDECISLLRGALEAKTDDLDLLFQLVIAHSSIGHFVEAKSSLKIIAEINPDFPELSYWLHRDPKINLRQGHKFFDENFYEQAQRCFEAVLIVDKTNPDAIQYREKCIEKQS